MSLLFYSLTSVPNYLLILGGTSVAHRMSIGAIPAMASPLALSLVWRQRAARGRAEGRAELHEHWVLWIKVTATASVTCMIRVYDWGCTNLRQQAVPCVRPGAPRLSTSWLSLVSVTVTICLYRLLHWFIRTYFLTYLHLVSKRWKYVWIVCSTVEGKISECSLRAQ